MSNNKMIKESTSYISYISYEIENMLAKGSSLEEIKEFIRYSKKKENEDGVLFPKNLEFIDAYFDPNTSVGACSFIDKNTGEMIIGVAGTNKDNKYLLEDLIADVQIGVVGLNKDSKKISGLNAFIQKMQKDYNVTTITGHSLGGAYAKYGAMFNDISFVTSYNSAPLGGALYKVLANIMKESKNGSIKISAVIWEKLLNSIMEENKYFAENYKGKEIRFNSDSDWLSPLGGFINGLQLSDNAITFENGNGHAILDFLALVEQKWIEDAKAATKFKDIELDFFEDSNLKVDIKNGTLEYSFESKEKIEIDFDGDGKSDLTFNYSDLGTDNLWYPYGGNPELVAKELAQSNYKINLETDGFANLGANLKNKIVGEDLEWITTAINLCKNKNDDIKGKQNGRLNELCERIVEALKNANLSKLLYEIECTHGELIEPKNKNVLLGLSKINLASVYIKLSTYETEWFLDGVPFDVSDLKNWVNDVQSSSEILYQEITGTNEFVQEWTSSSTVIFYRVDAMSDIANAFGDVTNSFLTRTEEVFKGIGLRSGKDDGIVDAISEVLKIEEKNIGELKAKINNVGEIALKIAADFETLDNWLAEAIKSECAGKFDIASIPSSYNAYLEENDILDDVKDVLEAYDLQVEAAANELSTKIVLDFEELLNRTNQKLRRIVDALTEFETSVTALSNCLDKSITSKKWKGTGQYDMYKEQVIENHGTLSSFISGNIGSNIKQAKSNILPILDELPQTLYTLDGYAYLITNLRSDFATIIEKAVYGYDELGEVVQAQNLINAKICTIIEEIKGVKSMIDNNFEGLAMDSYQEQLIGVMSLLNYFNLMLIDSFGENSNSY